MPKVLATVTVALGLLTLITGTQAQDAAQDTKRAIHAVKHGSAKDLAAALSKHFKGQVDVQAVPGQAGGFLLLNGPASLLEEIGPVLQALDRPPASLAVEIVLIDGKYGAGNNQFDERELAGPVNRVMAKLQALKGSGQVEGVRKLQLTALENAYTSVRFGESRPYTTGVASTLKAIGGKATQRMVNYRDTGTDVKLTPQVSDGRAVTIDLDLGDSRLVVPADGIPLGTDENGAKIFATEFTVASTKTRLVVPFDQFVVIDGMKVHTKARQTQTVALISVRLIEIASEKGK